MLTKDYQEQLIGFRTTHAPDRWGRDADRHAPIVRRVIARRGIKSVLDYGCGTGTLGKAVKNPNLQWIDYDPSYPGEKDTLPAHPVDLVVCTHVLEHVEPELLESTILELKALATKALVLVVPWDKTRAILPDGRNAHLTQKPHEWWLALVTRLFPDADITALRPNQSQTPVSHEESRFIIYV